MNLFVDVETLDSTEDAYNRGIYTKTGQVKALTFGLAVAYNDTAGKYRTFWHPDLARAMEIDAVSAYSDIDSLCYHLESANRVVTWNGEWFDLVVIAKNAGPSAPWYPDEVAESFDLFAEIKRVTGRWYGLEPVAVANLGPDGKKAMDGLEAIDHLKSGDPSRIGQVEAYCRGDVSKLVALYDILKRGDGLLLPAIPKAGVWQTLYIELDPETRSGTLSFYDDQFGAGQNEAGARPENVADRIVRFDADYEASERWGEWLPEVREAVSV